MNVENAVSRKDRDVVFIALFAALIAALGLIPQLMLISGVPITAQSLGVMLCGTVLGSKRGALAVLLFLLLVLIGLPLLSGGRGGIGLLATTSVGFLIGWPVAAFVTGLIFERWKKPSEMWGAVIASFIGCIVVLYVFGAVGIAVVADMSIFGATLSVLNFIPGDVIKTLIAGGITAKLLEARPQSVLSRQ